MSSAQDPYKYYRIEARELLESMNECVLEIERTGGGKVLVGKLLRLAHTLKGAARVVKQTASAELAHSLEDTLAPYRDSESPVPPAAVQTLLRLLRTLQTHLVAISGTPTDLTTSAQTDAAVGHSPAGADTSLETVRVDVSEMDRLLENVMEAGVQVSALQPVLHTLDECRHLANILLNQVSANPGPAGGAGPARTRALAEDLRNALAASRNDLNQVANRAGTELVQARDTANQLRLVPVATLFAPLERAVRDVATAQHKQIIFETVGGDVRVDAHVLNTLRDALLHVVRNAVVHGIETTAERRAVGKPPAGQVQLKVERRGHRVALVCRDDGRGVNIEGVRAALIRREPSRAGELAKCTPDEILQRLKEAGVSTSHTVTEMSGRGIGLDVLRASVAQLKGAVQLRTTPQNGTEVEVVVPISLASLPALEVELGGLIVGLPLASVRETLRIGIADVARTPSGETLPFQGTAIPYAPLARLYKAPGRETRSAMTTAVVLQAGDNLAAIGVERLKGVSNVVIKPLPELMVADPMVAGASLNPSGDPQPMLDAGALIERVRGQFGLAMVSEPAPPPPILIIDDSLTTRMLEQSILESAGYRVRTATSAEEALTLARETRFSLFVVDVEMPGMDGFGFVARTREDPDLREIPAILVTSRASPEDRRRGLQVGARAYIVKGEFDQQFLLQTIRSLMG